MIGHFLLTIKYEIVACFSRSVIRRRGEEGEGEGEEWILQRKLTNVRSTNISY